MTSFGQELLGGCGFSLIPSKSFMSLFLPTYGCCFLPSSWWHMFGNKVNLPYLSGRREREGSIYMLVSIL